MGSDPIGTRVGGRKGGHLEVRLEEYEVREFRGHALEWAIKSGGCGELA